MDLKEPGAAGAGGGPVHTPLASPWGLGGDGGRCVHWSEGPVVQRELPSGAHSAPGGAWWADVGAGGVARASVGTARFPGLASERPASGLRRVKAGGAPAGGGPSGSSRQSGDEDRRGAAWGAQGHVGPACHRAPPTAPVTAQVPWRTRGTLVGSAGTKVRGQERMEEGARGDLPAPRSSARPRPQGSLGGPLPARPPVVPLSAPKCGDDPDGRWEEVPLSPGDSPSPPATPSGPQLQSGG